MSKHQWRFVRLGGFDQVQLDTIADWQALPDLDQKLWAALACPTRGVELDSRTLDYIDTDNNGRIRVPELLTAVAWALYRLAQPDILLAGDTLPLSALDSQKSEGQDLLTAARELLTRLGKSDVQYLVLADTDDFSQVFPADQANGDGIVPVAMASTEQQAAALQDILACFQGELDRSGQWGVSAHLIRQFFADLTAVTGWQARLQQEPDLLPYGSDTEAAYQAYQAVAAKIDDYFMRTQLADFDGRATSAMNGSEAEFLALGSQLLAQDNLSAEKLPLASITPNKALPLAEGINPVWRARMQQFVGSVIAPWLSEQRETLSANKWAVLKARFVPYETWLAERPHLTVTQLSTERLCALQEEGLQEELLALVEQDLKVATAANTLVDLDKLVRYQRYLRVLLNNFVSFGQFYRHLEPAIFQAGTLYIDSRSCDLCITVTDMARHAELAAFSHTYLLYCQCTRKDSPEKLTIVAAVTDGDVGNLMMGRNGVFYDRMGRDWDAHVVKVIENAISVQEAFWSPYRRISRMISDQLQNLAVDRDKAVTTQTGQSLQGGINQVGVAATNKDANKSPLVPFDAARFAGIFAAFGLAIGALGTALASVITGFMSLVWWQIPLAIIGVILMISGPAMIAASFKLRRRNLAPILDANGWAVNAEAKLDIPFGATLTSLATLPAGAKRSVPLVTQKKV